MADWPAYRVLARATPPYRLTSHISHIPHFGFLLISVGCSSKIRTSGWLVSHLSLVITTTTALRCSGDDHSLTRPALSSATCQCPTKPRDRGRWHQIGGRLQRFDWIHPGIPFPDDPQQSLEKESERAREKEIRKKKGTWAWNSPIHPLRFLKQSIQPSQFTAASGRPPLAGLRCACAVRCGEVWCGVVRCGCGVVRCGAVLAVLLCCACAGLGWLG